MNIKNFKTFKLGVMAYFSDSSRGEPEAQD